MSLDVSLKCECCTSEVDVGNITHNVIDIAKMIGVYDACWHPENLKISKPVLAKDVLPILASGLESLRDQRDALRLLEPYNGWGTVDGMERFLVGYIDKCNRYPCHIVEARP